VHQIELEMQADELRRAHLALEESRDKYLDLYEFAPVGYFTLTDKGIISEANLTGAALLGAERRILPTARFSRFVAESDGDSWHRYLLSVLRQKEKLTCTLLLRRQDGTTFPARLESILVAPHGDGGPMVRVALSDITDIRIMEDALRVSNKKLNLLASITRHDINNQLTTLNAYLGFVREAVTDSAQQGDFDHVTSASERIAKIIQFTKEYEQVGVRAPVWQDCHALADTAARQIARGRVSVKNDLPAGMEIFADPLVIRVFYNLLENAIRHGGKITTIRIFREEAGGHQVIVCEDDGDGVPDEEKELIFGRGFGKNTGLGLALSREILAITGITIAESGLPGKGARFEMVVPVDACRFAGK
jgi:PAS domain S-box-containing protein